MRGLNKMKRPIRNPYNGPFRTKTYPSSVDCPKCKAKMNMISFKNDYVDDHKYECPKCEFETN